MRSLGYSAEQPIPCPPFMDLDDFAQLIARAFTLVYLVAVKNRLDDSATGDTHECAPDGGAHVCFRV